VYHDDEPELLVPTRGEGGVELRQLHYWLAWEGLLPFLGFAAFWFPPSLVATILAGGAVFFAPYMIWKLWQARRLKAIVWFFVVVIVPLVVAVSVPLDDPAVRFILVLGPIVLFYMYTWGLRLALSRELAESREAYLLEWQRQRKAV